MIRKPEPVAPTRANRDNFQHLSGQPLRDYAYSIGVSRSEAARMDDAKLKQQCNLAISRAYEEPSA